jgi:hypothetical protein
MKSFNIPFLKSSLLVVVFLKSSNFNKADWTYKLE